MIYVELDIDVPVLPHENNNAQDVLELFNIIMEHDTNIRDEIIEIEVTSNSDGKDGESFLSDIVDLTDDNDDRSSIITHITDEWSEGDEETNIDEDHNSKNLPNSSTDDKEGMLFESHPQRSA